MSSEVWFDWISVGFRCKDLISESTRLLSGKRRKRLLICEQAVQFPNFLDFIVSWLQFGRKGEKISRNCLLLLILGVSKSTL
jgi:hypothetical protein